MLKLKLCLLLFCSFEINASILRIAVELDKKFVHTEAMIDVVCDHSPLAVGETRVLHISGNGPFTVKVGFFVTDPPPLGIQEHSSDTVQNGQPFEIKALEEFWSKHKGSLQVDVIDATGSRRRLHFNVQPASKSFAGGVVWS